MTTNTTKRATTSTDSAQKRKRRRRNVRTADVSSSSDSDSDSDSNSSNSSIKLHSEVEMKDTLQSNVEGSSEGEDEDEDEGEDEDEDEEMITVKAFTEKSGRIPSPLRNLHDPQADTRFEEYYMRQLTTEFGDDLNSVRLAKDFGDKSLPMLVRALRQGVNIFDVEEKRIVVGSGGGGE